MPLAKELLAATSANLKLSRLTDLCSAFIENHTLKQSTYCMVCIYPAIQADPSPPTDRVDPVGG